MKCVMEVKPMDGKPDMGELLRKVDFLSGENERLNRENARLKGILSAHGIDYRQQYFHEEERSRTLFEAAGDATESQGDATGSQNHGPLHGPDGREGLTVNQILQQRKDLFRSLFKGREDVFATRWTSRDGSRSGYSPVCSNQWTALCGKPKQRCADCPNRNFVPLGDAEIDGHLRGVDERGRPYTIGVYAILADDTCNFLCADFDDKNCEHGYQKDVLAYVGVCKDWNIPFSIERSRSGNGAHVWILFGQPIAAGKARRLGDAILTEAMDHDGRMSFKSYDRFFPNQDRLPEGGFGNLVALPLQGLPRKKGNSVFVDENFEPYQDQWEYLRSVRKLSADEVDALLKTKAGQSGVGELSTTSETKPWETPAPIDLTKADLPQEITLVRSNMLYVPLEGLRPKVVNHLKRIASFKNPEFGAKLGMHLPTYNIPRIISCTEVMDRWLALPRGCEDAVNEFFEENSVGVEAEDKTNPGHEIDVSFKGRLRPEQEEAVSRLMPYGNGILSGTTAFGKTVTAIGLVARLRVNTLVLVRNKALAEQWREKFYEFLSIGYSLPAPPVKRGRKKRRELVGLLSSEEDTLNGNIDIALLQSCISDNDVKPFVRNYGMVIVDECHHVPAANFEQVLKYADASRVYGLTATPMRKDGHQPIIFMQCGPIRFTEDAAAQMARQNFGRILIPRFTSYRQLGDDKLSYNQILHELTEDKQRNQLIIGDVANSLKEGRTPIVISVLVEHVRVLAELIKPLCRNVIVLTGSASAAEKKTIEARLKAVPASEPLAVVASLKYISEGYDLPRLDTLFLAQPVSYKGLVAQYTGRLHREYEGKEEVRVYDYVDIRQPMCEVMYKRRLRGYASVGYMVKPDMFMDSPSDADIIYDGDSFMQPFLADIAYARHSIVIACPFIKIYGQSLVIQRLMEQQARGVRVYVHVRREGYDERKFEEAGGSYKADGSLTVECAVFDKSVCWYGDVNFLGGQSADNTVMRIDYAKMAGELLDVIAGADPK